MEAYRVPVETRIFLETESRSGIGTPGIPVWKMEASLYIYIGSCLLLDNGILF